VSIAQQADNPGILAQREFLKALYGTAHPCGYLEIGTEDAIRKITHAQVHDFYSRNATPQLAALVVAGGLGLSEARTLAEEYFDNWSGKLDAASVADSPAPGSRRILIVDRPNSPQTQLLIGQSGVDRCHPDYAVIEVLNTLLGGMFSSRINTNLREVHGYTYGTNSRFGYRRGIGTFVISGAIRRDATAPAIVEVFREIDKMRETSATPEELAIAKESLSRSWRSRFDTIASSADALRELFVYARDREDFRKALAQIPTVSPADVQRVAQEILNPKEMVVVAVGDAAKIENDLSKLNLGPVGVLPE
jgi:zinc protease